MAASIKIVGNEADEEEDTPAIISKKTTCCICVQKEARYTCPRCNVPYCSLECYRHKKHVGCSESFYKDCVMEEMKEQGVRPEDRQKMLEMLAREHDEKAADSDDDDADQDGTPDLSERLAGLDLDRDAGEVWRQLTPKEREEFARMLKDGRLSNLVSVWTPWWMKETSAMIEEAGGDGDNVPEGFPPHLSDVPDIHQLIKGKPSSEIKFNVINVISAYSFVCRLHNGDHRDYPLQCAEELLKICGVLRDSVTYPGCKEAVHSVIQEIQKTDSGFVVPSSFPVVLVGDVVRILQGPKLSPLCRVMSALSDLCALLKEAYREMKKANGKRKPKEVVSSPQPETTEDADDREPQAVSRQLFLAKKKATFLLSWAQRYGMCLTGMCAELSLELECLKCEVAENRSLQSAVEESLRSGQLKPSSSSSSFSSSSEPTAKIQQLN